MKIKILTVLFTLFLALAFSLQVSASPQDLGTCFIDSLNGKERKQLVKWMFLSMASHPELKSYSNITSADVMSSNKEVGSLITRLFVENCPKEAKAAQKADPLAIQRAFELVGQVAMQELMTNDSVMADISKYANYTDQSKINALFVE